MFTFTGKTSVADTVSLPNSGDMQEKSILLQGFL